MYPFEVYDETTKRVEFYFNLWNEFKKDLFKQYPSNFKPRIEIELINPAERLKDVKTQAWNPHADIGNGYLNNHDCFYYNENWSVIFDVYPSHNYSSPESYRILSELGHENPLGEKLTLLSTSKNLYDGNSIRYAYFRGKYWLVSIFIDQDERDMIFGKTIVFSDNGTSVIFYSNETKEYYCYSCNGGVVLSRGGDLPAVEYANGDKEWWADGVRHRAKGPAIIYGNKQYWFNEGIYYADNQEDYNVLIKKEEEKFKKIYRDIVSNNLFSFKNGKVKNVCSLRVIL